MSEQKKLFYFTFGSGQENAGRVLPIYARTFSGARSRMFELYGAKWSMQYTAEQWELAKDRAKTLGYPIESEMEPENATEDNEVRQGGSIDDGRFPNEKALAIFHIKHSLLNRRYWDNLWENGKELSDVLISHIVTTARADNELLSAIKEKRKFIPTAILEQLDL